MTARSWDKLPKEVLRRTFKYLERGISKKNSYTYYDVEVSTSILLATFSACQLVCKAWSKEAQRILYKQVHLGANIESFLRAITIDAPHVAAIVRIVYFSSGVLDAGAPARNLEQLFLHCRKIASITSETLKECEQVIWPTLLLDEIQLENLAEAYPKEPKTFDSYLYTLVQLKFRKSWDYILIKSLPPNHQDKDRAHLGHLLKDKLLQFEALKFLGISYCNPPTYAYFDNVLDSCAESVEDLEIETLDTNQWNSQLHNIKPNTSIQCIRIRKLILGDHFMQYLIRKFPNLIQMTVEFSDRMIELEENEEDRVFWDDLKQFLTVANYVSFHLGFGTSDVKAETVKCLHLLRGLECKSYILKITLWDMDSDQKPAPPLGISIEKSAIEDTLGCHVVLPRNQGLHRNHTMIKWKTILDPQRIILNGVEPMDKIYNSLIKSLSKLQHLRPFFDMNDTDDIKHLLTKWTGDRTWFLWYNASRHCSCEMNNVVLCSPPPEEIPAQGARSKMGSMKIEASIISTEVLPAISSRVHKIRHLSFKATCFLTDEPYTLKLFLPDTAMKKLTLNLAPLLKGIPILKEKDYLIKNSALENPFLLKAVASDGHYTLKIETESKTRIYKRHGSTSEVVDLKPEDVTRGSQDGYLVWIKLKELGLFAIERDDSMENMPSFKKFE